MKNVFTYGSLMFAPVWQTIVAGNYASSEGVLGGFERFAVKGEDYPVIKPGAATSLVEGLVYFDVSARDLTKLDQFEGEYYQRQTTKVQCLDGKILAEVYVLRPRFYAQACHTSWDVEAFAQQGIRRFLNRYKGFK
jgi:gamma-glutamylcyclotransferase (GGCT)/AIG2-like uncharacterized protein YtfP